MQTLERRSADGPDLGRELENLKPDHSWAELSRMIARVTWVCCVLALCGALHGSAALPATFDTATATAEMSRLLDAAASQEACSSPGIDSLLKDETALAPDSCLQPLYDFLRAEIHLRRGESDEAYRLYEQLVSGPLAETRMATPAERTLAAFALLRAIRLVDESSDSTGDGAAGLLRLAGRMLPDRPGDDRFGLPLLGNLSQLNETLLGEAALLAWRSGDEATAMHVFMRYLEVASAPDLDAKYQAIVDRIKATGLASEAQLALIRGKRFYNLRRFGEAGDFFRAALSSEDAGIRGESGLYMARVKSMTGAGRKAVLADLSSALDEASDPRLIEEILLYRAGVFNRRGSERDTTRFLNDLAEIARRFPESLAASDALYEAARYYEGEGHAGPALEYLERLRTRTGPNNWTESSYFRAALILYQRNRPGDMDEAVRLLTHLGEMRPPAALGPAAYFWLGRITSERGDSLSARRCFERAIDTCPYDYYAIRARMHLNLGTRASGEVRVDSITVLDLAAGHSPNASGPGFYLDSVSDPLLRAAVASGIYAAVASRATALYKALPSTPIDGIGLEDLDRTGTYAPQALLLALRKQAIAAAGTDAGRERLAVAGSIGAAAGDWPFAMLLLFGLDRSVATQAVIQRGPGYLRAAYPPVYTSPISEEAGTNRVPPELLYAVMRRESLFFPSALSNRGAIGLFQFIPSTFEALDTKWHLLASSGAPSMEAFLRDPDRAIALGARWFGEELLARNNGNVLLAVMEHNAGYPAVSAWMDGWEAAGRDGDIEYMIETAGFAETRIFARSVLADMAVVEALDLFGANPPQDSTQ